MNRILASIFIAALLCSSPAMAADTDAGTCFYGPPPTAAQITKLAAATDGDVSTATQSKVTYINVKWPDVSLSITVDPTVDRQELIYGARTWVSGLPAKDRSSKLVAPFLADLDRLSLCYGSVVTPDFDKEGKVVALLKKIVTPTGGYFFTHQTFYTIEGVRIVGVEGAPSKLGPK